MRIILMISIIAQALLATQTAAVADSADREATYRTVAMKAAQRYDRKPLYTYAPHHDAHEVAASTVAINAHILLEAYRADKALHWLEHARVAADSLIAHSDMNGDGKVGWGRFWDLPAPSGDALGGNTTFVMGCNLPRNRAYDDELYDDARIGHFLLELHRTTGDERYLVAARQMIDDTWDYGAAVYGGKGFAYFKTIGPCDKGWQVKNINMLMAVPMALLAVATGESRYRERAEQLVFDQRAQIERDFNGEPAPNLGYYSIETMASHKGGAGTYVERAQIPRQDGAIECNMKTGSGESCIEHLGIEARGFAFAERNLGRPSGTHHEYARIMLAEVERHDVEMCSQPRTKLGNSRNDMSCSAYYCTFRQLDIHYDDLCSGRIAAWGATSQDTILSLFWGVPGAL